MGPNFVKIALKDLDKDVLDQLQDLDGALAVGGHHHVAVFSPGHSTHKLIHILVLSVAIQEGSHSIKFELEQVLTQTFLSLLWRN